MPLCSNPEKILALFPGALGDFICFLPALAELARRGTVDLLARPEYADLTPVAVRVGSLECQLIEGLYRPEGEWGRPMAVDLASYSRIYSWTGWGQGNFMERFRAASNGTNVEFFPFLPREPKGRMHMVDYYLRCIGAPRCQNLYPAISLAPHALAWHRCFSERHQLNDARVLVLAPGSGAREKNWPSRSFAAVSDWWRQELGGKVVVILGPVEEERGGLDGPFNEAVIARELPLSHVAALIRGCELYIGNDSGVSHLAAALGAEAMVLFGPSDRALWAPRGSRVTVIHQPFPCSPCQIAAMKACAHRNCLETLSPEDVIQAAASRLRRHFEILDKPEGQDYS